MVLAPQTLIILLVTLVVVSMTWLHHARALAGRLPSRRPLLALDALRSALGRGAETGRSLHVSPGSGLIGAGSGTRGTTAETFAGLMVASRIAEEAALNGAPILVSSGDVIAHLSLRGAVRQAYQQAGQTQDYDAAKVLLLEASVLVGSFGQEFLLIGESGAQRNLPQVAGSTNSAALPLMLLTTPSTLIGEEIFAAEAYLAADPAAQSRLMTQDLLRTVVIALVIGGLVYGLIPPSFGLPSLAGI
ncbi:MAG: DUF6754 domain-containing protein [Chloroflexales bacterium]